MVGLCTPGHPSLLRQELRLGLSVVQSALQPFQYFCFNPSYSVEAESYPLWELPDLFQSCNVLRRVKNELLYLWF